MPVQYVGACIKMASMAESPEGNHTLQRPTKSDALNSQKNMKVKIYNSGQCPV